MRNVTIGLVFLVFAAALSAQDIPGVDVKKAHEMAQGPATFVVDVRSVAEYVWVGHPDIAHNVPFAFWDDQKRSLVPNQSFAEDLKARFKLEDTLLFLCRAGGRSRRAAEAARAAGFLKVFNIQDGFEGGPDEQGHWTVGGWKNSGLPYTYKVDPKLAYKPAARDKGEGIK